MDTIIKVVVDASASRRGAEAVKRQLNGIESEAKETGRAVDGIGIKGEKSFKKLTKAAGALGIGAIVGKFFGDSISNVRSFSSAIDELSAITGAAGDDLDFLAQQAKEFGTNTIFSASESAEAFKLIASAKPDLLESGEALAEVTNQALTLAQASGSTLPDAASTLGSALNQFGADAEQAGRFINVLAAGAKFGASEIAETAQALKESGTVASAAGISFEELNAGIQALSTVSIKGGQAGTNLRNVILKLQGDVDTRFNPAVVGLNTALQNLQEENLSTAELTKIFGLESVTSAAALIEQAGSLDTLTGKLTGTNTAFEQAIVRTDNLNGDIASLSSAYEGLTISVGENSEGGLRVFIQTITEVIKLVGDAGDEVDSGSSKWEGFADIVVLLAGQIATIGAAFEALGIKIGGAAAAAAAAFSGPGGFGRASFILKEVSKDTQRIEDDLDKYLKKLDGIDEVIAKNLQNADAIREAAGATSELSEAEKKAGNIAAAASRKRAEAAAEEEKRIRAAKDAAEEAAEAAVKKAKQDQENIVTILEGLNEEILLIGAVTREEELGRLIQAGVIAGVTKEQESLILAKARELDLSDKLVASAQEQDKLFEGQKSRAEQLVDSLKTTGDRVDDFRSKIVELQDVGLIDPQQGAELIENFQQQFSQPLLETLETSEDKISQFRQRVAELQNIGLISPEQGEQLVQNFENQFDEILQLGVGVAEELEANFSSGFFDILQGNFDGLADSFKATIDRMVADLLASQLFDLVGGTGADGLGGVISSVFGGSDGGSGGLGALFGGFFADGGLLGAGQFGVVGEEGAELVTATSRGTMITPIASGTSGSSGTNVTVNMNVSAQDAGSFERSRPQILAGVGSTINRAVERNT